MSLLLWPWVQLGLWLERRDAQELVELQTEVALRCLVSAARRTKPRGTQFTGLG